MIKTPVLITLLILLILASLVTVESWEAPNYQDFARALANSSLCGNESDLSNLTLKEMQSEPSFTTLQKYMARNYSRCEQLYKGAYHWLDMYDPRPYDCAHFYIVIHDWVSKDLWNWRFMDCGLDFKKSDWEDMVTLYLYGFEHRNLMLVNNSPPEEIPEQTPTGTLWDNYTNPEQTDSGGGGGGDSFDFGDISLDKSIFASRFGFPILMLVLVIYAFLLGRKIWHGDLWAMYFGNKNLMRDGVASFGKKIKYFIGVFAVLNIVFWVFWLVGGLVFTIFAVLFFLAFLGVLFF